MKSQTRNVLLCIGLLIGQAASATIITFDDLPFPNAARWWNGGWTYGTAELPPGYAGTYAGFYWNSAYGMGPQDDNGAAYYNTAGGDICLMAL